MMNDRDLELLSAYLDGQLTGDARLELEARLTSDAVLRDQLETLRETKTLIGELPLLRAPRALTLTPQMVGASRRPQPIWLSPWVSGLSAAAALILIVVGVLTATGSSVQSPANDLVMMEQEQVAAAPTALSMPTMTLLPAATQPQVGQDSAETESQDEATTTSAQRGGAADQSADTFAESPDAPVPAPMLSEPALENGLPSEEAAGAVAPSAELQAVAPTPSPLPTLTPVPSLTPVPTETATPTALPTIMPTPTLAPVEVAPVTRDVSGFALVVVGLVLLVAALVTTFMRRRR